MSCHSGCSSLAIIVARQPGNLDPDSKLYVMSIMTKINEVRASMKPSSVFWTKKGHSDRVNKTDLSKTITFSFNCENILKSRLLHLA